MNQPNDPAAFPVPTESFANGMTLRDYFAAKAMAALLIGGAKSVAQLTEAAYGMADAMLAERNK